LHRQIDKHLRSRAQVFAVDHSQRALYRLLNHGLVAIQRQQLLGTAFAAERPEARAAPSSENDGIELGLSFLHD